MEEVDERGRTERDRVRERRDVEKRERTDSEGIDGEQLKGERKGRKLREMSGKEEKKEQGNDTSTVKGRIRVMDEKRAKDMRREKRGRDEIRNEWRTKERKWGE